MRIMLLACLVACARNVPVDDDQGVMSPSGGTATPGEPAVVDTTAPTLTSWAPSGTLGGPQPIIVVFSEPMAADGFAFSGPLAGAIGSVSVVGDTLTLLPTGAWPDGDASLTISQGRDQHGNALLPQTHTFLVDAVGPVLSAVTPSGSVFEWTTALSFTADEPVGTQVFLSGSLGTVASVAANGVTLTLSPAPTWNADSSRTLSVIGTDVYGNPGPALSVTYDVRDGGVYVKTDGDDAALGTKSAPVQTLGHAMLLARGLYDLGAEVRVAEGTYVGPVVLPTGMALLGGYPADFASAPNRKVHISRLESGSNAPTVTMGAGSRLQGFSVVGPTGTVCNTLVSSVASSAPIVIQDNSLMAMSCTGPTRTILTSGSAEIDLIDNEIDGEFLTTGYFGEAIEAHNTVLDIRGGFVGYQGTTNAAIRGIEFLGETLRIDGCKIIVGSGRAATGVLATSAQAVDITRSFIYAGEVPVGGGLTSTAGVALAAGAGKPIRVHGNYIHGGVTAASGRVNAATLGGGDILFYNNVLSSGCAVGDSTHFGVGVQIGPVGSPKVFNNTIHAGNCSSSIAISLEADNAGFIENNILFFDGSMGGALVRANTATRSAQTLRNNVFYNYDGATNHYGYQVYGISNGAMDTAAVNAPTGATGNIVADPQFFTLDSGAHVVDFFTSNFDFAYDWRIHAAGPAATVGINGESTYGFSDDLLGQPRPSGPWAAGAFNGY